LRHPKHLDNRPHMADEIGTQRPSSLPYADPISTVADPRCLPGRRNGRVAPCLSNKHILIY
jgi:hypothetical protein